MSVEARSRRPSKSERRMMRTILLEHDPYCWWCRKPLDTATATADHVIPLSRGGDPGIQNVVLSCVKCNVGRGNRLPFRRRLREWAATHREYLAVEFRRRSADVPRQPRPRPARLG